MSNEELIALILRDGTINFNAKELSSMILSKIRIEDLRHITLSELISIKGIGISKASSLLAAIELGIRISKKVTSLHNVIFKSVNDVFEYFKEEIGYNTQESFYTVYLDSKNMIIETKELFKGTLNHSMVHPREIFKEAYLTSSASIILIHNHPSGNVLPSKEDILLTKRIIDIGNVMGIKVMDHIIVSSNSYYSFYENGDI